MVQESLTRKAWKLALEILAQRTRSMSWHSNSWPGLLALLLSTNPEDARRCVKELVADWRVFAECKRLSTGSLFLANLCKYSVFSTRLMSEVVDLLPAVGDVMEEDCLQQLIELARHIFEGWGASKIVETANKEIRDQETFDSTKKALSLAKIWDSLRTREVITSYERKEVDPEAGQDVQEVTPGPHGQNAGRAIHACTDHYYDEGAGQRRGAKVCGLGTGYLPIWR